MRKFIHTEAIVVKRFNYGEADRFVTLSSRDYGKVPALARGVRKLSSRKRVALEPLNQVKVSLVEGRSTMLLTEAILLEPFTNLRQSLNKLTQAMQLMEIVEGLIAEDENHLSVYQELLSGLLRINGQGLSRAESISVVKYVLDELGFGYVNDSEASLKDHIESITQKRLLAKEYLLR